MIDTSEGSAVWEHAKSLYQEGRRAYHTFQHALDVLERVEKVEKELGFFNYQAARLAALYHDAIYVAGSKTNELDSANAMNEFFFTGKAGDNVMMKDIHTILSQAICLIEDTAHHMDPQDYTENWDTILFMDCDVLGFAEPWETFKKQNDDIAYEYGVVDADAYNQGRVKFLAALYKKGVFRSPYFKKHFEDSAIMNIRGALQQLGVEVNRDGSLKL